MQDKTHTDDSKKRKQRSKNVEVEVKESRRRRSPAGRSKKRDDAVPSHHASSHHSYSDKKRGGHKVDREHAHTKGREERTAKNSHRKEGSSKNKHIAVTIKHIHKHYIDVMPQDDMFKGEVIPCLIPDNVMMSDVVKNGVYHAIINDGVGYLVDARQVKTRSFNDKKADHATSLGRGASDIKERRRDDRPPQRGGRDRRSSFYEEQAEEIIGIINYEKKYPMVRSVMDRRGRLYRIADDKNFQGKLKEGAIVKGILQGRTCEILEILEHDFRMGTLGMISVHELEIPHVFPSDIFKEIKEIDAREKQLEGREDLRKIPLVTIDGEDAKDFDDAVYACPDDAVDNPGGYRIIVAIADVSYFVRPSSALDEEAFLRGVSVYLPGQVVPMLPSRLSDDLCSLRPHEDRFCLALHMTINASGDVLSYRFARAVMRSHARLTYTQVWQARQGTYDEITAPLADHVLAPLWAVYDILHRATVQRGVLNITSFETYFTFEEHEISAVKLRDIYPSHTLIEYLMVLSNIIAAKALGDRGREVIYRVHDIPPAQKQEIFQQELDLWGLGRLPKEDLKPNDFNIFMEKAKNRNLEHMMSMLILRSQAQAQYDIVNRGHFGLNLTDYCHFTSPIRRYADLTIHRELVDCFGLYVKGEEKFNLTYDRAQVAEQVSILERRAVKAERDASRRYGALYYERHLEEVFEGVITGVMKFGVFVTLHETGVECFVPIEHLPHDRYIFDVKLSCLRGRKKAHAFRMGGLCRVRMIWSDAPTGTLHAAYVSASKREDSA